MLALHASYPLLQAVRLQELKFQMAVRDQIISEQRDVISNLWAILGASGLTRRQVMGIARAQGIVMQVRWQ
jgi:kinesin family protein 18/19